MEHRNYEGRASRWKNALKAALVAYAFAGSCYMVGEPRTGHPSADFATRIREPTRLERTLFDFVGIDYQHPAK